MTATNQVFPANFSVDGVAKEFDVLVVTTTKDELGALFEVTAGRLEPWEERSEGVLPYHVATFEGREGHIRVAAARSTHEGGPAATGMSVRLLDLIEPGCLAMCGMCAGHPEGTDLGDVVIADRVFQFDHGTLTPGGFEGDQRMHSLSDPWLRTAQDMEGPAEGMHGYALADEDAGRWWFLEQLLAGRDPLRSAAIRRYLPDDRRPAMLESLRQELGYVSLSGRTFSLTAAGRHAAHEREALYGTLVTQRPYHIRVGPMGSGNSVVAHGLIWEQLAKNQGMRKALALEKEAASIGQIAYDRTLPFVVVKGVTGHADGLESYRFERFAARASAEVLMRFLRQVTWGNVRGAEPELVVPEERRPVAILWDVVGVERRSHVSGHPGLNRKPWIAMVAGVSEDGFHSELEHAEALLRDASEHARVALPPRHWLELDVRHPGDIGVTSSARGELVGLRLRIESPRPGYLEEWAQSLVDLTVVDRSIPPAIVVHLVGSPPGGLERLAARLARMPSSTRPLFVGRPPHSAGPKHKAVFDATSSGGASLRWRSTLNERGTMLPPPWSVIAELEGEPPRAFQDLVESTQRLRPETLPALLGAAAVSERLHVTALLACYPDDDLLDAWLEGASLRPDALIPGVLTQRVGLGQFLALGLLRHRDARPDEVDACLERLAPSMDRRLRGLVTVRRAGTPWASVCHDPQLLSLASRAGVHVPIERIPDELFANPEALYALWTRDWSVVDLVAMSMRSYSVRSRLGLLTFAELTNPVG